MDTQPQKFTSPVEFVANLERMLADPATKVYLYHSHLIWLEAMTKATRRQLDHDALTDLNKVAS